MNIPEHYANAADWALPTLFSWLPAEVGRRASYIATSMLHEALVSLYIQVIVWAISLLLCEAKVVVVGSESGMVSCAVMGLLVLLRPLDWQAIRFVVFLRKIRLLTFDRIGSLR